MASRVWGWALVLQNQPSFVKVTSLYARNEWLCLRTTLPSAGFREPRQRDRKRKEEYGKKAKLWQREGRERKTTEERKISSRDCSSMNTAFPFLFHHFVLPGRKRKEEKGELGHERSHLFKSLPTTVGLSSVMQSFWDRDITSRHLLFIRIYVC